MCGLNGTMAANEPDGYAMRILDFYGFHAQKRRHFGLIDIRYALWVIIRLVYTILSFMLFTPCRNPADR